MRIEKLANYAVIFIGLALLAIILKTFQAILRPLAIAMILVFVFTPLAQYSRNRNIPVWLTFTGLIVVAVLLLSVVGSIITVDNVNLESALPRFQERISQDSEGILAQGSKLGFGMESVTPEKLGQLAAKGAKMGLSAVRTIFSETLMALILLMFLIQAQSGLFHFVERKSGTVAVARLRSTFQKIEGDILAYFSTKFLMSLGTAVGTGVVLFFFGAKFIFISLLIVFMLNFIPIIGSLVAVVIVSLLYALTFGFSINVLWLFLALMAVQVFFGNILEPKIAGKRLKMSPILIVISLYVWGWIWGVVGMFLSVPLTIFIMILARYLGEAKTPALEVSK